MPRRNDRSNVVPFYLSNYDRLRDDYSWRQGFSFLFLPSAFVLLAIGSALNAPPLVLFLSFFALSALFTVEAIARSI